MVDMIMENDFLDYKEFDKGIESKGTHLILIEGVEEEEDDKVQNHILDKMKKMSKTLKKMNKEF